jgi:uncharacterized cofD-like protein
MNSLKKNVVVIGGGTGTYTVLSGLKAYSDMVDITAIVTMADSGGSTGRLRDEFGQLPVGDARMVLSALATDVDSQAGLLRELFLYRFTKGEGLAGHNFGNLLLTALADIVGSTGDAIAIASQILRVEGTVIPVTSDNVHLVATYATEEVVVGEHAIDEAQAVACDARIISLAVTSPATINPAAALAIKAADLIVLGPGDLYTSILANCVVDGVTQALRTTTAPLVYVCNLMSRSGQTIGMQAAEYVQALTQYIGRSPDYMIYNQSPVAPELLAKYVRESNHLVLNNYTGHECQVLARDVVASEAFVATSGDVVQRSLVRHDSQKLAKVLLELFDIIKSR